MPFFIIDKLKSLIFVNGINYLYNNNIKKIIVYMSILSEIERIQTAKTDIKDAIEKMGEVIPSETKLSGYAPFIEQISKELCLITTVNIGTISTPVKICSNSNITNAFDYIEIDGVRQEDVKPSYTFDSVGTHIIRYKLKDKTQISQLAFNEQTSLTGMVIPSFVTTIGEHCFHGARALETIRIPANVTNIEQGAFWEIQSATLITVDENNEVYDSRDNCNAIIETATNKLIQGCMTTVIPNTVTTIDEYAFEVITGLTEITIPSSVTAIGQRAFQGCTALETFIFESETPPRISVTSLDALIIKAIYVPDVRVDTYKNAANWGHFESLIKPISEKPTN